MTNEEARNQIEAFRTCMIVDDAEPYVVEALNMAIEALDQQPCEDCISRQAVLDYIDEMPSELTADGRRMIRRRTLEEYISDTLPPVQPKVKGCEDAISRSEVLKIINFEDVWLHNAESHNANTEIAFYSMLSKIKVLPYTQPKMGRWIMDSYSNVCECSECAYVIDKSRRRAYCPMCGAKMESEERNDKRRN